MNAIQQEAADTVGYLEQKFLAKEKNEQCGVSEFEEEVRYGLAFLFIFVVLVTVFWIEKSVKQNERMGCCENEWVFR